MKRKMINKLVKESSAQFLYVYAPEEIRSIPINEKKFRSTCWIIKK